MTDLSVAQPAASGSADPRNNLVGLARSLAEVDRGLPVHDLYDDAGSELYDALGWQNYDTATAVKLACHHGGPVLDLACGTGRIGLAIAQRGVDVVGVDLSTNMLDRFRMRLHAEPPEVAALVELVRGDMHNLDLGRRFRLAVLGATTIVLVDPALRRGFFERVRAHLEPEGSSPSISTPSTSRPSAAARGARPCSRYPCGRRGRASPCAARSSTSPPGGRKCPSSSSGWR